MICKIVSHKVQYKLTLYRRISVIKGKSGIGKSHIIQILNNLNDINYYVCDRKIAAIPQTLEVDVDSWLDVYAGFLLFADENVHWAHTSEFADKLRERDIWLVIISRSLRGISARYSVAATYTLHESGKFRWNVPYYDKVCEFNPALKTLTEDSKSGYKVLSQIFPNIESVGGKDKFSNLGVGMYNCNVVADGAAFGQILSKYQVEYILGKINFILPESFEWLLLQSGLFNNISDKISTPYLCGANDSKYDTWENYFEDLLNNLMLDGGAHGYSKSSDMRCFTEDCCYKDSPCELHKRSRLEKVNNVLKLLGCKSELV